MRDISSNFCAESDFMSANLEELDRLDLVRRYKAAEAGLFWTQSSAASRMLERAFSVRAERGDLSRREIAHVGRLYLAARQFERAQRIQKGFDFNGTSSFRGINRSRAARVSKRAVRVWRAGAGEGELVLDDLQVLEQLVVVVMRVGCGPSGQTLQAITNDPEMRRRFEERGLLLHAAKSILDLDGVTEWHRKNPELEISLVDMMADWPWIRHWGTPSFYLFRDGELVNHLIDWKAVGTLETAMARLSSTRIEGNAELGGSGGSVPCARRGRLLRDWSGVGETDFIGGYNNRLVFTHRQTA
ncbi:MAG: hypothetical protein GVY11_04875 [Gammaproteobacteria bacterium]|nr:hypothetical protein [Gammaproteobacteria bacterium]